MKRINDLRVHYILANGLHLREGVIYTHAGIICYDDSADPQVSKGVDCSGHGAVIETIQFRNLYCNQLTAFYHIGLFTTIEDRLVGL